MTQPREPDGRYGFNNPNQILRALVAARGQRTVARKPTAPATTDANALLRAVISGDTTQVPAPAPAQAADQPPTTNELLRLLTGHTTPELTFTDKENTDAN